MKGFVRIKTIMRGSPRAPHSAGWAVAAAALRLRAGRGSGGVCPHPSLRALRRERFEPPDAQAHPWLLPTPPCFASQPRASLCARLLRGLLLCVENPCRQPRSPPGPAGAAGARRSPFLENLLSAGGSCVGARGPWAEAAVAPPAPSRPRAETSGPR